MKKYSEYTEKQLKKVHKLLDRFAMNLYTEDGTVYKYQNMKQVLKLAEQGKEVYCNTISGPFLVAGQTRGIVGLTGEIIRQADMYADFGEEN